MTDLGLRERKKSETRRAIADAALDLALRLGPDGVTVDDIARAADVSPRTVFNHFGTKDEAVLGVDPERRSAMVAAVRDRPTDEAPLAAIGRVFAEVLSADDSAAHSWLARAELVRAHPHLRAAQLISQEALERDLAQVVALRTGLDVVTDAYPALVVAVALTTLRQVLARSAPAGPAALRHDIDRAFAAVASGLQPPRGRRR